MDAWLQAKLDHITTEFLGGGGYGAVYEAQFLAYLEVLLQVRGQDPARVWTDLEAVRKAETPEGEPVRSFSHAITDRQELADALKRFQRRFSLPRKAKFIPPPAAQVEPASSSDEGGDEDMDLFDFFDQE